MCSCRIDGTDTFERTSMWWKPSSVSLWLRPAPVSVSRWISIIVYSTGMFACTKRSCKGWIHQSHALNQCCYYTNDWVRWRCITKMINLLKNLNYAVISEKHSKHVSSSLLILFMIERAVIEGLLSLFYCLFYINCTVIVQLRWSLRLWVALNIWFLTAFPLLAQYDVSKYGRLRLTVAV